MNRRDLVYSAFVSVVALTTLAGVAHAEGTRVSFARQVRPLLADRCFACHGPDRKARKAKLRLDVRESATSRRRDRVAVSPGDPTASEMLRRVLSSDPDERMPPPDEGESLKGSEVALLERWIAEGAEYDTDWAYVAPQRSTPPAVKDVTWPRGSIDRYILAALEKDGWTPSPPADRVTLARRLSFDLIGMVPTPQEVDAFLADDSPDAYERLVDRLLCSPRFGERIAVYWLDLVRFADTAGIHADNTWDIFPYRDYVINAFNTDLEFDRFTREQLGGDLMPDATLQQRVASSYNRLNMISREGGSQAKEFLIKYTADRVRNVSTVWLASTIGCAECHDHKFDPLTSKEFYQLGAFFADIEQQGVYQQGAGKNRYFPPYMPVPSDAQVEEIARLDHEIAGIEQGIDDWAVLRATRADSREKGVVLRTLDDGSILASGANPEKNTYEIAFERRDGVVTAIRLEALGDPGLPRGGPGRAGNGNFVLTELEVLVGERRGKLSHARATFNQSKYGVAAAIDGDSAGAPGWAVMEKGGGGRAATAVFEITGGLDASSAPLRVVLHQNHGNRGHTLGRFRISVSDAPLARLEAVRRRQGDVAALRKKRADLRAAAPVVMATRSVKPMTTRVLPRGNWMDDSGEVVLPGVPAIFGRLDVEGRATRLDLADWLTLESNPAVARVFVNRLWKLFFGRGIVQSTDDFGRQGTLPGHPRLLDHLAIEFLDSGWSVRHVVKRVVLSAAYRQSSDASAEQVKRDPYNARLARQARFRLDAEFIRDNALRIAGLLSDRLAGPSVRPYQPAGYYSHLNFPRRTYQHSSGESLYRRSLYTHWQRQFVHPSLMAFDAPSRERCTVERMRSNTPLAALVLLNDPIYVEAARAFANRIVEQGGSTTGERLRFAFRRALSRSPEPRELKVLADLHLSQSRRFGQDPDAARKLLSVGSLSPPGDAGVVEYATWTAVSRVLLNLHEVITRY